MVEIVYLLRAIDSAIFLFNCSSNTAISNLCVLNNQSIFFRPRFTAALITGSCCAIFERDIMLLPCIELLVYIYIVMYVTFLCCFRFHWSLVLSCYCNSYVIQPMSISNNRTFFPSNWSEGRDSGNWYVAIGKWNGNGASNDEVHHTVEFMRNERIRFLCTRWHFEF